MIELRRGNLDNNRYNERNIKDIPSGPQSLDIWKLERWMETWKVAKAVRALLPKEFWWTGANLHLRNWPKGVKLDRDAKAQVP